VLIGALAANRYRRSPRLTQDVDLLLADTGAGLEVLEAALRDAGWDVRRATPDGDLLRLKHSDLGIADLMIAGTDYQRTALERARGESIGGGDVVPVLGADDVIVHKLIAGRNQDLADIEAILESGNVLDEGYIERWADFWDVSAQWRELRSRAR